MKLHFVSFAVLVSVATSCTNTIFLSHQRAYDANVSLAADLTKVVGVNAGFEGESLAAVPPEEPLAPEHLFLWNHVAKGEALSTLSALKVQHVKSESTSVVDSSAAIDFIASTATGAAADGVAKSVKEARGEKKTPAVGTLASTAAAITTKATSIPAAATEKTTASATAAPGSKTDPAAVPSN